MSSASTLTDEIALERLRKSDTQAFASIFSKYYYSLLLYCNSWIAEQSECEDIVQNVFVELWEQREHLKIASLKSYLLRCVRHDCLDAIKHRKIVEAHAAKITTYITNRQDSPEADAYVMYSELENIISNTLNRLDQKSVEAFKMSRWEGRKYDEIAEIMDVSRRTIEVRITKVIQQLRLELQKYFPFIAK